MGILEGSCRYWARGASIRGNFVLSTKLGCKTAVGWGGSPCWAKRSSDHQVAYPEVKVQVRDLVQV